MKKREQYSSIVYLWIAIFVAVTFLPRYFISLHLFVITIIAGFYLSRKISENNAVRIFSVFLIAYLLRVSIAVILYKLSFARGLDGYFYGRDDFSYGTTAFRIVDMWKSGSFPNFLEIKNMLSFSGRLGFYEYYIAILMLISNNSSLLPIIINCSLSALSILVLYSICKNVFAENNALTQKFSLVTISLFAFWPSILFWSTLNLKSAPTIFLLLMATLMITKLFSAGPRSIKYISYFFGLGAFLLTLSCFRKSISSIALAAVMLSCCVLVIRRLLVRKGKFTKILLSLIMIFIICAAVLSNLPLLDNLAYKIDTERNLRALGSTVIMPESSIHTFGKLVSFLPAAIIITFFYPLPWHGASLINLISFPEMVLWYIAFPFFIRGLVLSVKSRTKAIWFGIFFTVLYFLSMGFLDGNAGTLFRHRAVALPFAFIFIAAGCSKGNIFKQGDSNHE